MLSAVASCLSCHILRWNCLSCSHVFRYALDTNNHLPRGVLTKLTQCCFVPFEHEATLHNNIANLGSAFAVEVCFFWGDLAAVTGTRRGKGMAVGRSSLSKDSSTTVAQVHSCLVDIPTTHIVM